MTNSNQKKIWNQLSQNTKLDDVLAEFISPRVFQLELKPTLDKYAHQDAKIIEVGCNFGASSFILDNRFQKTLLDLNSEAIEIARQAYEYLGVYDATFVVADMFDMPFDDGTFDVVFNAGVIEHFSKEQRTQAIIEYQRILNDSGTMIIAYPNNKSIPYFTSMKIRKMIKRWSYPDDFPMKDFCDEVKSMQGLTLKSYSVISKIRTDEDFQIYIQIFVWIPKRF